MTRCGVLCASVLVCAAGALQEPIELNSGARAEFVAAHNAWRSRVGVGPVKWSTRLEDSARKWANTMARRGCRLQHSDWEDVGENLFLLGPWRRGNLRQLELATPTEVVDEWAAESVRYSYETNRCSGGQTCGHYTQIVWRQTESIGCAATVCADRTQLWVCQYSPPGNIVGRRPY
jgi:pathogenesis-related protein 1